MVSAHSRRARAESQLVVECQHRQSVSCNVIAQVDCQVTGGISGHYSVTCSLLILFLLSLFLSLLVAVSLTNPYAQIYSIPSLVGPLLLG